MSATDTRYSDDSFDVQASLRRLRQTVLGHVPMIVVTVLVTLALVLLYVRLFPPIYSADLLVAAEPQEDTSRTNYYAAWDVFRKGDIKSEPTLMTSRTVAERVVQELDLKFHDVHHSVLTHLAYLWTDSWLGRRYRQLKEWVFAPDPDEYRATDAEIDRARTIEAYRQSMVLEPVGTSNIGRLIVRAPSFRAAEFANKTIEVYLLQRRQVSGEEAEAAYQSLKAELARVSATLAEAEAEKLAFDRRNGLSVEFERDKVLLGKWGELRTTIADLEAQIGSATAGLAVVEQNLAREPAEVVSGRTLQESRVRSLIQQREFELGAALQALAERYRPDSPEILEAQRLLAEARAALAKEPERSELSQTQVLNPAHQTLRTQRQQLSTTLASNRAMLALRRADYEALTARLDSLPLLFREAQGLARKREALEGRYRLLNERFMMADVSRSAATRSPSSLRVVDYASRPMKKSWPDLKILLPAAVVVGLIFGVGLALLAEMLGARVTRGRLAGRRDLPLYAVVGATAALAGRPRRAEAAGEPAFPDSALARLRLPATGQRSYAYFSARMNESAARRLQLENDLYRAVERHELVLHFQPRHRIANGQPSGFEALLRWKHPQRGLVPAAEFITLAEDTGLIVTIGEWALRAAARQIVAWGAQGRAPMPLAVNLSASQFRQHDLVARVQATLQETGIAPELLEIEITEATLMQQTDQKLATLDALKALGVRLSIDDVGARHSGLAYLQRFPVNQIKIDRAFVRDMLGDAGDAEVVRAIIAFAHGLQLKVVAEGVETQAQLDFLRQSGCEEAQGFLFGQPVPADELVAGPGASPSVAPLQEA